MDWTGRDRFQGRQDLSLLYSVQTVTAAHPASYEIGTGGDFLGG
jgi:hypothetical protein